MSRKYNAQSVSKLASLEMNVYPLNYLTVYSIVTGAAGLALLKSHRIHRNSSSVNLFLKSKVSIGRHRLAISQVALLSSLKIGVLSYEHYSSKESRLHRSGMANITQKLSLSRFHLSRIINASIPSIEQLQKTWLRMVTQRSVSIVMIS